MTQSASSKSTAPTDPEPVSPLAFFHDLSPPISDFLSDTLEGLSGSPKSLLPKYFYDERGSYLFEKICETDEYYVTRTELSLLSELGPELSRLIGLRAAIIEYGAGASVKVRKLLDLLVDPALFVAVDISGDHLKSALEPLQADYPHTEIGGICADFTKPELLPMPDLEPGQPVLGFFPGSTIGNLARGAAQGFLEGAARHLGPGNHLLIGVDLVKDARILTAAYNDETGYTAAFNLNLLQRINDELEGTIDLARFSHQAIYEGGKARIEMHLKSLARQTFRVSGHWFAIGEGETIHTENSHKYSVRDFQEMAKRAGFRPVRVWVDEQSLFSIHLLRVDDLA